MLAPRHATIKDSAPKKPKNIRQAGKSEAQLPLG
jgi:hypothetical protein